MKKILLFLLAFICIGVALTATVLAAAPESGTIEVNWNKGYAVIAPTNGRSAYLGKDYTASSRFHTTDVFTVPKAGTKITWTDTGSLCSNAVLTLSSWKKSGNSWVFDSEGAMFMGANGAYNTCVETKKANNVAKYTYVTSKDNENLRICINGSDNAADTVINYTVTGEDGTWAAVQSTYPSDPSAPIAGATAVSGIKWYNGYVGSANHSSAPNKITDGSSTYAYSSVFTVPKKGTTVYFYDDLTADASGTKHASSNVYGISTWKKSGADWAIDLTGDNIAYNKLESKLVGNYMLYWYTTTADNQNIRITYAAGLSDFSLVIRPYTVWTASEAMVSDEIPTGVISEQEYIDPTGAKTTFKIYLPKDHDKLNSRSVFVFGGDTKLLEACAAAKNDIAVINYNGSAASASAFMNTIISTCELNKYRVFAIGEKAITDACESMLAGYLNDVSSYATVDKMTKALFDSAIAYHEMLEGITLYAMGDSYFGGSSLGIENTWVNRMGDRYAMSYINYGIGGSTVSDYVTDRNPMVVRYKNMAKGDPDVILLEGGRNDRSQLVPLGTNTDRNSKTFLGAINIMLDDMLTKYPNAIIILVTPWNHNGRTSSGLNNISYADAMRNLVVYRNDPRISCLYAADPNLTGVNMNSSAFRAEYCVNESDVSHLNLKGMKLVQPIMEKFIADALADYDEYLANKGNQGSDPIKPAQTTAKPTTTTKPITTTAKPAVTTTKATTTTAKPIVTTTVAATSATETPATTTTAAPSQSTTVKPSMPTVTTAAETEEGGCGAKKDGDAVAGLGAGVGIAALASVVIRDDKNKSKKKKK